MNKTDVFESMFKSASKYPNGENKNLRGLLRALTLEVQNRVCNWRPTDPKDRTQQESTFQVLDFFCGCGGMSLGFAALSKAFALAEVIGGCDINSDALCTFGKNFNAPGIKIDVRDLVDDDKALSDFFTSLPRYQPNKPTILIGCAPCQGFTSHRKKNWDKDDHRNTLIGAFASIAARINPECIVMENVPEMLSKKYWDHFQEAKLIFERAGYIVSQAIYNVASFGVPQDRFRALVIAMKKRFLMPRPLIYDSSQYKTVRDAIGNLRPVLPGEALPEDPMHRSAGHKRSTIETIRAVPKDGGSRPTGVGPECLDRVRGFYDVYGRLAWDRPSITITHYARNPASGRYVHPEQDRGLTMREAALLQGFPIGFEFCGTFDSIFKQIGEAVPPPFAAAVAANCVTELLSGIPDSIEESGEIDPVTEPVNNSFSSVIAGLKMARRNK